MPLLDRNTLATIQRDLLTLINGPDGCACTLTWTTQAPGATYDAVFKKWSATVTQTQTCRVHINRIFKEAEIVKKKWADVVAGDAILLLPTSVVIEGKENVQLVIAGAGTWTPVRNPPPAIAAYAPMVVSGRQLVQMIFARRVANA